jgi:glutamate formiminotransferase / 5-formyltetrahydrofolate cyclo-ligase
VAQFSLVQVTPPLLLAVPNVSEGRDAGVIETIGRAFTDPSAATERDGSRNRVGTLGVGLIDTHSDPDHDRSVYTLAGPARAMADAVLSGARAAVELIDVMNEPARGQHPRVGALDVAPIVYLEASARGAACAEALVLADRIGSELDVPVFLYGELAAGRSRAEVRRGGVRGLATRLMGNADESTESGEARNEHVRPDFGPPRLHPSAGATLVAAREPLVAFNLCLSAPASVDDARAIAAAIREGGGEGMPGVRAIGVLLGDGRAQVSMNIERPLEVPLAAVVEAVARHAPVRSGELVGLAPSAALEGFPQDLPLVGFDPERHVIENALGSYRGPDKAQTQDQAPG